MSAMKDLYIELTEWFTEEQINMAELLDVTDDGSVLIRLDTGEEIWVEIQ